MEREGEIRLYNTNIGIWENDVDEKDYKQVYDEMIRHLRNRDFKVFRCPFAKKHYKCLSATRHRGVFNHLEFKMSLCGRHIEIEFFQNINKSNPNGGEYDFDKFFRMSYLMQKKFIIESAHLIKMLVEKFGYTLDKKLTYVKDKDGYRKRVINAINGIHPTRYPLKRFNDMWNEDRFVRDESGWPLVSEYSHGGNKDRDGNDCRNGQTKYFRDRSGYLKRAIIYTNMNAMWQTIYGPGKKDNNYLHARELFTLQSTDRFGRWFSDEQRIDKQKKMLKKSVKLMDFEKAAILRDLIPEYHKGIVS